MATDSESLTQLARLLGERLPTAAQPAEVQQTVDQRFERLVDGLTAEAAASDDVFDRDSALDFLQLRVSDLRAWLSESQRTRLLDELKGRVAGW